MNVLNKIMSYDKNKKLNESCNCEICNQISEKQIEKYSLSEEEIEQIVKERYLDKDEKTKTFIRKALRIHGDRYDYSNVVYVKSSKKVEIICRVENHESFWQTCGNHLQGQGCPICGGKQKLTTEEFIEKSNEVHGYGTYDYSKVKYVNMKTKVIIICPKHGEFTQIPLHHIRGVGCPLCCGNKKLTTEEFIEKANEKQGIGTYNYSKVEYINSQTEVIIICPKHGEFKQIPNSHLNGKGCPICGIEKQAKNHTLTTEEFIESSNEVHGKGTYDYSETEYIDAKTKVIIICPKHGKFTQTPNSHLSGNGCPKCAIEKLSNNLKLTTEEFIEKSNETHGVERYDYSKVEYINSQTEVIIICPKHGEFTQTPSNHMRGKGCPKCAKEKLADLFKLTTEEFIEKSNEVHEEGTYDYSKVEYVDYHTNVIMICSKHGEFLQTPATHLRGGGCPKCNKNKGEDIVRKFLMIHNIEFEEQKTFEGCKYKQPLKFDFYLPKYNLCVESDGTPHFKKINWNGKMTDEEMEENLKLNQHRDNIKNEYCEKNGISLLRLNNLETFEEKLTEYFQTHEIIKS